jgi:hypothetical protein
MRTTVEIVHKSQLPQLFTNRKWQMAPSICIDGNGGICEQLRFVNNGSLWAFTFMDAQSARS